MQTRASLESFAEPQMNDNDFPALLSADVISNRCKVLSTTHNVREKSSSGANVAALQKLSYFLHRHPFEKLEQNRVDVSYLYARSHPYQVSHQLISTMTFGEPFKGVDDGDSEQ